MDVGVIPKLHESIQQYSKLLPDEIAIIGNLIRQNSEILQSCLDHGLVDEFLKMLAEKIDDPCSFDDLCEVIDKADETQLKVLVEKDILTLFCKSLKLTEADL